VSNKKKADPAKAGKADRDVEDFISSIRTSMTNLKGDGLEWTGAGCCLLLAIDPDKATGTVVTQSRGHDPEHQAAEQAAKTYGDAVWASPEDDNLGGYL
jgi:hypothetical protein